MYATNRRGHSFEQRQQTSARRRRNLFRWYHRTNDIFPPRDGRSVSSTLHDAHAIMDMGPRRDILCQLVGTFRVLSLPYRQALWVEIGVWTGTLRRMIWKASGHIEAVSRLLYSMQLILVYLTTFNLLSQVSADGSQLTTRGQGPKGHRGVIWAIGEFLIIHLG